jgi:hypothetical protein
MTDRTLSRCLGSLFLHVAVGFSPVAGERYASVGAVVALVEAAEACPETGLDALGDVG